MNDKRPASAGIRRECWEANKRPDEIGRPYMICHICGGKISPPQEWEAEHYVPFANGGTKVLPAHTGCHKEKTRRDVSEIAKGKRVYEKHWGIKRTKSIMPGSRRSKWKRKMNGEVVER